MRSLIRELIPNAPQIGLHVAPDIPEDKLSSALADFAKGVSREDVLALYDATLMGSAKDGAVFTNDAVIFQNNDLEPAHDVRYQDLVQIEPRRKLLGGRRLNLTVNRGRATFELIMDFSGKPRAADYVLRFLREAMLHGPAAEAATDRTDVESVESALRDLKSRGLLSSDDFDAIRELISRRST